MTPILLNPVRKTLIWGSEEWGISAHPNGDAKILNPEFKGQSLSSLYKSNPEIFGECKSPVFPLLTKIIDARDDLSIQVHPDDQYASENEKGSLGKTECWYIIDAEPGTKIVIGHNAKNSSQVKEMIETGRWSDFIREVDVQKGDFFFIEPGTVHAIKGGTKILETQQSSDITYRVYDYGRLQDGKPRPLHIKQSIDVIKAPYIQKEAPLCTEKRICTSDYDSSVRQLVSCSLFTVWHADVKEKLILEIQNTFMLVSVISGSIVIDSQRFDCGQHFIVPALKNGQNEKNFTITGSAELIISTI